MSIKWSHLGENQGVDKVLEALGSKMIFLVY